MCWLHNCCVTQNSAALCRHGIQTGLQQMWVASWVENLFAGVDSQVNEDGLVCSCGSHCRLAGCADGIHKIGVHPGFVGQSLSCAQPDCASAAAWVDMARHNGVRMPGTCMCEQRTSRILHK